VASFGPGYGPAACLSGHGRCAADHARWATGAEVLAEHDIRVEDRDEALEVTGAGCPEEGVDDFALVPKIRIRSRQFGALDAASSATGQLSRRLRGDRSTIEAISSEGSSNMSWRTNASRSAGRSRTHAGSR
jgi:hypothetical protein